MLRNYIPLSDTIFELFDVEWYHDLEIWVRGRSSHSNRYHSKALVRFPIRLSYITMALSWIICEIKRDIGRKTWFFHNPLHSTPLLGGSRRYIAIPFGVGKQEWWGYPVVKKMRICTLYNRLDTIPACDRRTDGRTSCHGIVRAMHTRCAVKIRRCT